MAQTIPIMRQAELSRPRLILTVLTGIFMIQSVIIGGLNFSFADLGLVALLLVLFWDAESRLPLVELSFLAVIFISRTLITLVLPTWLEIMNPSVFVSILKLGLIMVYFVAGYLIGTRTGMLTVLLKTFLWANVVVGVVGMIVVVTNTSQWMPWLFTAFRLKGLMNDPNYFSMLQLMSLPLVGLFYQHWPVLKGLVVSCLTVAAILSGSKSALLVLCLYGVAMLVIWLARLMMQRRWLTLTLVVLSGLIMVNVAVLLATQLTGLIHALEQINPSFSRVSTVFSGDNPLTANGSDRTEAWTNALQITTITSGLGIGFHEYAVVAQQLLGDGVIAHNTVLQLLVEWGLGFTFIFICYVGYQLWRGWCSTSMRVRALTKAILICLMFSMSISLNNSRVFWVFFGIWCAQIYLTEQLTKGGEH